MLRLSAGMVRRLTVSLTCRHGSLGAIFRPSRSHCRREHIALREICRSASSLDMRSSVANGQGSLKGRNILVVGAGAIGLRTAWELLQHQANVVIEAPRHPLHPETCSMGAGGLWMPYHAHGSQLNRWALETLDELWHMASLDPHQNALVELLPLVMLFQHHQGPSLDDFQEDTHSSSSSRSDGPLPEWVLDARLEFQHLTIEMLAWQNLVYRLRIPPLRELHAAGYRHAWLLRQVPVVDPPRLLAHYLHQMAAHPRATLLLPPPPLHTDNNDDNDATVMPSTQHHVPRFYASVTELCERARQLNCHAVVNCTGMGAASICQDDAMVAARGILHHYHRSADTVRRGAVAMGEDGSLLYNTRDAVLMTQEIWGSVSHPCYLIPRGNVLVVGGTYLERDDAATIRHDEAAQLRKNAHCMGIAVEQSRVVDEWVGFRPSRTTVRCELDTTPSTTSTNLGVDVFHSYGYGGSGWTLNVGAAKECTNALIKLYS
jgi:D-amino-acid oxidase